MMKGETAEEGDETAAVVDAEREGDLVMVCVKAQPLGEAWGEAVEVVHVEQMKGCRSVELASADVSKDRECLSLMRRVNENTGLMWCSAHLWG